MNIIITKGDSCTDHVRVKKFIKYFDEKEFNITFFCWLREREKANQYTRETFIFKGGGYANNKLLFLYPIWIIKLFCKLLFNVKNSNKNVIFTIDFDSAIAVYFFTFLKPKVKYIYDVHDDFSLRYSFPKIIKKVIEWFDRKVKERAFKVIHVDDNRVRMGDNNYEIIYNSQDDYYEDKPIELMTEIEREFAFTGLIGYTRGVASVYEFAKKNKDVTFIVAGKVIDHEGEKFIRLPNVEFLGYISQEKLFKRIKNCLGIFSLYDTSNKINILAASNKLYDSIMLGVPVIVNKGIEAEKFVKKYNVGSIVSFDYNETWSRLLSVNTSEYNQIRMHGREIYINEYSFKKNITDKMNKIVEELYNYEK
ncbi:hypothetical protein D7030_06945 [Flavobacteriaceae bacterium AU392]|nr:hypothetical protein D1817_01475 [Flavobacteriaceae bacterium]RKM84865.1 hypothetical protein D7030_06945 [Flavobacteriaceae bacterium AU392]